MQGLEIICCHNPMKECDHCERHERHPEFPKGKPTGTFWTWYLCKLCGHAVAVMDKEEPCKNP